MNAPLFDDKGHPDAGAVPLGLSLSAIMLAGFMLVVIVEGVGNIAKGGRGMASGLGLVVVGAVLMFTAYRLYRRSWIAWVTALAAFVVMFASSLAGGALLSAPLFLAPVLLLLLPGSRDALRRGPRMRKERAKTRRFRQDSSADMSNL